MSEMNSLVTIVLLVAGAFGVGFFFTTGAILALRMLARHHTRSRKEEVT